MAGIKPTVETDHEGHTGAIKHIGGAIHLGEIEADRLLTQDGSARLGRRDDVVHVRVGGGADRHRIGCRNHLVRAECRHAVQRGDLSSGLG